VAGYGNVSIAQSLSGLRANTVYYYRAVATNTKGGKREGTIQSFLTEPATPAAGEALDIGATQATVVGTVDPEGHDTHYYVEYGAAACAPTSCRSATSEVDLGSGTNAAAVAARLSELKPRTTYHYRLVVANSSGASYGVENEFTTPPLPPEVSTGIASGVTQTSATISGTVNPEGYQTSYEFETGVSTSYGSQVFGDAGFGLGAQPVEVSLQDLAPGTTYHYRLTATSTYGTTYGQDMTFTTPGVPSPLTQPLTAPLIATPAIAFPTESGTITKTTTKALTRAEKLAAALKACRMKVKGKRAGCVRRVRKEYAAVKAGAKRKHNKQH
jgi:phosphodiesterase/alkaline phosphatase D-like protein